MALFTLYATINPVERAVRCCGITFAPEYGTPKWVIYSAFPCAADTIEFTGCGHPAKDFQEHVGRIAAAVRLPIKNITEPGPGAHILQLEISRSRIPDIVNFTEIDLARLHSGSFMYGKTESGWKEEKLEDMIHLLVAGQTGGGKTIFVQQLALTVLLKTRGAHAAVIDMKGGVDFPDFRDLPNCELVLNVDSTHDLLDRLRGIHDLRTAYLAKHRKRNWREVSFKEVEKDSSFSTLPIGPILVIADELAELTGARSKSDQKQSIHARISELARMARATGIHLILGTQRPDRTVIDGQIKDSMVTRLCFSVPSIAASNIVLDNMAAFTIGRRPGRAFLAKGIDRVMVQAPYISSNKVREIADQLAERLKQQDYARHILESSIRNGRDPMKELAHEQPTGT